MIGSIIFTIFQSKIWVFSGLKIIKIHLMNLVLLDWLFDLIFEVKFVNILISK